MLSRLQFYLSLLQSRLWIKPAITCVIAVLAVLFCRYVGYLLPLDVPHLPEGMLTNLLNIIATSMLAVATFSVTAMVSAYGSAANSASPRSLILVISDARSQTALSSFIGAFIYAVVSLIAINVTDYGPIGRMALLVLTVLVFAWVILTFVSWVDRLARLGRISETAERVETTASKSIALFMETPNMGCHALDKVPQNAIAICGHSVSYVAFVDVKRLNKIAEEHKLKVFLDLNVGSLVTPDRPLLYVNKKVADDVRDDLCDAITTSDTRTYQQDPRLGLIVLSEIASRALSPAVNDPGTGIEIITRQLRLLCKFVQGRDEAEKPLFTHVWAKSLSIDDLITDAFVPIARDGAAHVEVMMRLLKALNTLASLGNARTTRAANLMKKDVLARAKKAMHSPHDIQRLKSL